MKIVKNRVKFRKHEQIGQTKTFYDRSSLKRSTRQEILLSR